MQYGVALSTHFVERLAQCHLSSEDVAFILEHGRVLYRTGIRFYFLGWRDIPQHLRQNSHVSRLEGVTLLLSHGGILITTYKNSQAARKIRRKSKRRWPAYPAHRTDRVSRPFSHTLEGLRREAEKGPKD